jgi:3-oxoacyl-[acyl-carrier-protein] synthase-3
MYVYTQGHSRLISTGVYLPEQRITTRELMQEIDSENRYGLSYGWLERVTGIREKRVTPPGVLPSDMAVKAAQEALERSQILPNEIDAIIYTGLTRDYLEPATAHIVQAKLGANNATVFDVSNACHGFMNGIHLMDALIATGQVRRGLVVTGEQGSLFTRKAVTALKESNEKQLLTELAAGFTLGDAGAAMLMGPKLGPDSGFMGFMLQSQGQHAGFCTSGAPMQEGPLLTDMPAIISESTKLIAGMFQEFLYKRLKWRIEDLSKYVIHQVGGKAFKLHSDILGVPLDIMPKTVSTLGNLITANIPLCVNNFYTDQEVNSGSKIYLSGVGSGISLSQAGLIWEAA